MEKSLVFGLKCEESSKSLDHQLSLLRMLRPSEKTVLGKSSTILPFAGMMQNGLTYELPISEHPTKGGGYSSLRMTKAGYSSKGLLPTPLAHESKCTPHAPSEWKRKASLSIAAAKMMGYDQTNIGTAFRLNPRFVEEMMGYPIGWTELEH